MANEQSVKWMAARPWQGQSGAGLRLRVRRVGPALGYFLISLFATWPLITHLRGWVPGIGDWGQNVWALWWTRHALLALAQTPFFTNYLFYPEGVTLLFHPLDVSDGLLALPLYGLLGGDASYNVIILLSFVLGGWGTYLLALYLTRRRAAGFVAGLIFALSPYHFLRIDLGHLNLSSLQWLPFYTLFLLKFVKQGSKRSGALAVFFLVFTALNSWYYVIYCGLLTLALLFWPGTNERIGERANKRIIKLSKSQSTHTSVAPQSATPTLSEGQAASVRNPQSAIRNPRSPLSALRSPLLRSSAPLLLRLIRISLVLAAALIILSPLLLPMLRLLGSTTLIGAHNPLRHSVDLLSFWVPGPPSTWAGWFEDVWISYAAQNREPGASAYLGYTMLALSLASLLDRRRRRQTLWWLAIALGFTLLALGPQLQLDGQMLELVLPYQLLSQIIPIFSITGIPGRFVVMTSLALAVLSAYGLTYLSDRLRQNKTMPTPTPLWLCLLAGVLISLEYLAIPLRLSPTNVADFYHQVAAETESYAVIDLKWDANFLMHAQTIHGKPLVGGWLARLPASQAAYLDQGSLDKAFLYLLLGPEQATTLDPAALQPALQTALAQRQVRYIIDHDGQAGPWLEQFVGWPVVYRGEDVVVYGLKSDKVVPRFR